MKTSLGAVMVCMLAVAAVPSVGLTANTPQELANKQLVLDYYRDIDATVGAGKVSELPKVDAKYRHPDYIQHSGGGGGQGARGAQGRGGAAPEGAPGAQGRAGGAPEGAAGARGAGGAAPAGGPGRVEPRWISVMAEGDMVNLVRVRTSTDADGKTSGWLIFNLFRVKDGKLVEHWDASGNLMNPELSWPKSK
jgi:predicted SnoaL-like aldol condensation-catalyzing enzyme